MEWWLACGITGALGGMAILCIETIQGQRTGRLQTFAKGFVTSSRQPVLFRFLLAVRWLCIGIVGVGSLLVGLLAW